MTKHDSGVMEGEQDEMENELVDRSPGRNSDANETQLDSCIRQSLNEDISMPSVTSFISFSFLFHLKWWNNLPLRHFFSFFVSFHLLSTEALLQHYQLFPFLSHYLFILPPNSYLYLFPHSMPWFICPRPRHHLSSFHSFSLINAIMLSLMCASPRVCP